VDFWSRWLRERCRTALAVFSLLIVAQSSHAATSASGSRLFSAASDEWELAIASDSFHHVYVLYPQRQASSSCDGCDAKPALTLVVSDDDGATWQAPRQLTPPSSGQLAPEMSMDANDHKTIYATWLERNQQDVILAKSADFGQSWSEVVAARATSPAEKPVVAASGQNVYLAFARGQKVWVAASHDGGITFALNAIEPRGSFAGVLAGGVTIDAQDNAFVAWAGYVQPAGAKPKVDLYISKSADAGKQWAATLMDVSSAQSGCAVYQCPWGYLGAQITVTSDSGGTVYALWNAIHPGRNAGRVYFASSTTAGETWSPKVDVSEAPAGTKHVFPTITSGAPGEVRVAWIDSRNSPDWSAYYRTSTNGGATWSAEKTISNYVPNSSYIPPDTFDFLFGAHDETASNAVFADALGGY
jgi:BNR repeat-like domain